MRKLPNFSSDRMYAVENYRQYLEAYIGPPGTRSGLRVDLARALQCHPSQITLVLQGKSELSLEQAELLNEYLGHSEADADYFLDLVQLERAGTEALRKRIRARLSARLRAVRKVENRVTKNERIAARDKEIYYSDPLYCVLHVLTSLPQLSGVSDYARALRLPEEAIRNALRFLCSIGLVSQSGRAFRMVPKHVHLPDGAAQIVHHHRNLRAWCSSGLPRRTESDLHYSLCFSASDSDIVRIRSELLAVFAQLTATIERSPEERLAILNLDLFDPLR